MRQAYYSVPARYAGRRLQVRLGATTVTAIAEGTVVAVHTRSLHKYTEDLVLDHYLEVLSRKPGALAGATALASARTSGAFTATHQRYWDAARKQLGDGAGTRALIGVLLLHRSLPGGDVAVGMIAAAATPPAPTPAVTALGDQAAEAVNDGGRARSHMPGVGPNGVVILISGIDCTTLLESAEPH
ncbi:MAG: Mu transposase domain-containing protein [Microbacterium sp.]